MRPVNDVYISGLQCWPTVIDTAACSSLFPLLSRRRLVSSRMRDRDSFPRKREHVRPIVIIDNRRSTRKEHRASREFQLHLLVINDALCASKSPDAPCGGIEGGAGGRSCKFRGLARRRARVRVRSKWRRQRTFLRNRYDLSSVDYIRFHPRGPLVGVGRAWKSPCPPPRSSRESQLSRESADPPNRRARSKGWPFAAPDRRP